MAGGHCAPRSHPQKYDLNVFLLRQTAGSYSKQSSHLLTYYSARSSRGWFVYPAEDLHQSRSSPRVGLRRLEMTGGLLSIEIIWALDD